MNAESAYLHLRSQIEAKLPIYSSQLVFAGIGSGGGLLAKRLGTELERPFGQINILMHRDDHKGSISSKSSSLTTHLPFRIHNATIILVDDVLFTGRTIRAALNEIFDFGRPQLIHLAVLLDRQEVELPIAAQYVGTYTMIPKNQRIRLATNPENPEQLCWVTEEISLNGEHTNAK